MMTISENFYSSNKMSNIYKMNDRVVHRDSYDDVKSSSSEKCELLTKRGFKPSDMFDPQKKAFLTNLSYKLFPVSWVSLLYSNLDLVDASNTAETTVCRKELCWDLHFL